MKLILNSKDVTKSLVNKVLDKISKLGIAKETDAAATILSILLEQGIGRKILAASVLSDDVMDEMIILMTVYTKLISTTEKNNIIVEYDTVEQDNPRLGGK